MDHLEWSERSDRSRFRVPFVVDQDVDLERLDPGKLVVGIKRLLTSDIISLPQLAKEVQTWLYFGLLKLWLQNDFSTECFIEHGVVHTRNLERLCKSQITKENLTETKDGEAVLTAHAATALAFSHAASICFSDYIVAHIARLEEEHEGEPLNLWNSESYVVLFTVPVLLSFLRDILGRIKQESGLTMRLFSGSNVLMTQASGISRTLVAIGRCPSFIRRLKPTIAEVYSLFSFPPNGHHPSHKRCSIDECRAYDVIESEYQTKHTDDCVSSDCGLMGFEDEQLFAIIDQGCIPLVCSTLDETGNLIIQLRAGQLNSRYTAVSHVWAGGLGNLDRNFLPLCQLRRIHFSITRDERPLCTRNSFPEDAGSLHRLKKRIQNLRNDIFAPPETNFWLDTLCVPVYRTESSPSVRPDVSVENNEDSIGRGSPGSLGEPVESASTTSHKVTTSASELRKSTEPLTRPAQMHKYRNDYRRAAINAMARIYAGAERVLVLDPELETEKSEDLKPFEMSLALACSPWMTRSWTLHEGALALNLEFKFASSFHRYSEFSTSSFLFFSPLESLWKEICTDTNHPERPIPLLDYFGRNISDPWSRSNGSKLHNKSLESYDMERFVTVWNALTERRTTRVTDVALILASLLNLSAGEVLTLDPDRRMKAILKHHSILPASILLQPTTSSVGKPDWTPKFPSMDSSTFQMRIPRQFETLKVTADGLVYENFIDDGTWMILQDMPDGCLSFHVGGHSGVPSLHITFFEPPTVGQNHVPGPMLLWLSSTTDSKKRLLGLSFTVVREDMDAFHVAVGDLLWYGRLLGVPDSEHSQHQETCALVLSKHSARGKKSLVIDLSMFPQPLQYVNLTLTDIQSWPDLRWSRTRAFPFLQLGAGGDGILECMILITMASWILPLFLSPGIYCVLLTFSDHKTQVREALFSQKPLFILLYNVIIMVRIFLLYMETLYFRIIEARWMQESWATSFWDPRFSVPSSKSRQPLGNFTKLAVENAYPHFALRACVGYAGLGALFGLETMCQIGPSVWEVFLAGDIYELFLWQMRSFANYREGMVVMYGVVCFGFALDSIGRVFLFSLYLFQWNGARKRARQRKLAEISVEHHIMQAGAFLTFGFWMTWTIGGISWTALAVARARQELIHIWGLVSFLALLVQTPLVYQKLGIGKAVQDYLWGDDLST
ncbi:uncharacterized protein Z518_03948 [Rhinocladiella mackenziei CBS 650.93]|uniref:Heterokaryon incompatibility domain-containing protein n=1 Tax=Rhinocladiella mackenziei CBS 650.93 TaxID=1442369 RepID=A0A0D2IJU8_9EURO|nr:uncharacterized protein Z518_03948 [Rhinocladiella mackenziei CBS 650.93]KIX05974.1 hypothetical protein Z518_03948 [Rhinocladiella mackenziei CBS 650.93]